VPYKRGRRWYGKIEHRGRAYHCGSHETKKQAQAAEVERRKELGAVGLGGRESCGSFARRWPDDYPLGRDGRPRKPRTVENNRYEIAHFASHPDFKDVPIADVRRPEIMRYAREHPRQAKVVRIMFSDAYNDGLIPANHALRLGISDGRGRRPVMLSLDEMRVAAEVCERVHGPEYGPRFRAMFEFACWTGCRPGELFALTRDKLRPAAGELDITIQRHRDGREGTPKNGEERTVALPPQAVEAIRDLPRRLDGLLFWSETGVPMTQGILSRDWGMVRVAAGVDRPDLTWYQATKHFCGSQLALAGVQPPEIGWQLGHTDNGETARKHYIHLYPQETKAKVLEGFRSALNVTPLRQPESAAEGA
jgi:integrase